MKRMVFMFILAFFTAVFISAQPNVEIAPSERSVQTQNAESDSVVSSGSQSNNRECVVAESSDSKSKTLMRSDTSRRRPSFYQFAPRNFSQRSFSANKFTSRNIPPRGVGRNIEMESINIEGYLTLSRGRIAVNAGDMIYLVNGLSRYVGFVEGFMEGAKVRLEGSVMKNSNDEGIRVMRAQKMTFNGKDYVL